ncbi:MAG: aKG-HExxH-type peptide beta-hydroxylase [Luteimonas sp.]
MSDNVTLALDFACAHGSIAADLVPVLAMNRLESVRDVIAKQLQSEGHDAVAAPMNAFKNGDGNAWRPETGLAQSALGQGESRLAALQWALASAGAGGIGVLETELDASAWLFFEGWLLVAHQSCSVIAHADHLEISSASGRFEFCHDEQGWRPTGGMPSPGPWNVSLTGAAGPRYMMESLSRNSVSGFPWPAIGSMRATPSAQSNIGAKVTRIREACQLITAHGGEYASWVASTAAGCMLLDDGGLNLAANNSGYEYPGLIAINPPDSALHCSEILVHESSRQQLLAYMMVAALVEDGKNEIFYSPLKRSYETIGRMLISAHVTGNIVLYYRELERSILLDSAARERYAMHRIWFAEHYVRGLSESWSLTEAGRALWQRLQATVAG